MRTIRFSCLLSSTLFAVAVSAFAQDVPDWSKVQLKATKVAGTVYMIDMVEGTDGFAGAQRHRGGRPQCKSLPMVFSKH